MGKRLRYCSVLASFLPLILTSCASFIGETPTIREGVVEVVQSKDSPGMVVVPAGKFFMGVNTSDLNSRPEHEVFVGSFDIDKYEVSAKEFSDFLNAKGNPEDQYFSEDKYSTIVADPSAPGKYMARSGLENYPANNVSWFGASAYCDWKGKRLPSEAEWEKAARGKDKRKYPWGNSEPGDLKAVFNQKWQDKGFQVMVPVDALPEGASYYGVLNMAGNVWEWVSDWFKQSYCDYCNIETDPTCMNCYADIQYETCAAATSVTPKEGLELGEKVEIPELDLMSNPGGPYLGSFRVLRGGSWYDSYGDLVIRATYRYWLDPSERYFNTGFRCAK